MNTLTMSLVPRYGQDVLLYGENEIETCKSHLEEMSYSYHHTSIRNGYVPINGANSRTAFLRPYSGYFGIGFILCERKTYSTVFCSYFVRRRRK